MAFELQSIVPWGPSFEEYVAMFALSEHDLSKRILGCGDGPTSFNTHLTQRGGCVVSVDPLYAHSTEEISKRIDETFQEVLHQARLNRDEFVWDRITSVDELGQIRMASMRDFLADYETGKAEKRYLPQALPRLDFPDRSFDLCICSHFLFLYSDQLDLAFHLAAIKELCRVSEEVRIFPLLKLGTEHSPHVEPVCEYFTAAGYEVSKVQVSYEFQRGGDKMLQLRTSKGIDSE